jgi:hypothetical protein
MHEEYIDKKAIRNYRKKFQKLKRELKCSDAEAKYAMTEPESELDKLIRKNGKQ